MEPEDQVQQKLTNDQIGFLVLCHVGSYNYFMKLKYSEKFEHMKVLDVLGYNFLENPIATDRQKVCVEDHFMNLIKKYSC